MARLHEYQGKALLRENGIDVPRGRMVESAEDARRATVELGGRVVVKAQAWITSRKARGGVVFAADPDEAAAATEAMLALRFGNFPVQQVLVEELIDIDRELFVSLTVDDLGRCPLLLVDVHGGSGIEERADSVARLRVSPERGLEPTALGDVLGRSEVAPERRDAVARAIHAAVDVARRFDARSLEINPLVTTTDGAVVAADCRMTIDDYAVFRHPELGIEIARELDHPATPLEREAYRIENEDHRGTFYFAQLPVDEAAAGRGIIGFHGAGGGGSMMSMDAVSNEGYTLANFCDTSGNPSVAKVYRAARIILAQADELDLVGYFGSGSGVASQEQYHSAYGLAKAFREMSLSIPAVIRLGGNSEDRAVEILRDACADLPATVEGYRKDDTPAFCAARFRALVESAGGARAPMTRSVPPYVATPGAYEFSIAGGRVVIDHASCDERAAALAVEHAAGLLALDGNGRPVLAVEPDDVQNKDSELIACEIELARAAAPVLFVDLPIELLDAK